MFIIFTMAMVFMAIYVSTFMRLNETCVFIVCQLYFSKTDQRKKRISQTKIHSLTKTDNPWVNLKGIILKI